MATYTETMHVDGDSKITVIVEAPTEQDAKAIAATALDALEFGYEAEEDEDDGSHGTIYEQLEGMPSDG